MNKVTRVTRHPSGRPVRSPVQPRRRDAIWNVPLSGYVNPRLRSASSPTSRLADAVGFTRLADLPEWEGTWAHEKEE